MHTLVKGSELCILSMLSKDIKQNEICSMTSLLLV